MVESTLPALLVTSVGRVVNSFFAELTTPIAAVALASIVPPADEEDAHTSAATELECGVPFVHSSSRMDENWTPDSRAYTLLTFSSDVAVPRGLRLHPEPFFVFLRS